MELFGIDDRGPLPTVILLAEDDGDTPGSDRQTAQSLAGRGYVVAMLAPRSLEHDSFEALLSRLAASGRVDVERLALMGIGAAAEHALRLAAEHPSIRAVVAIAPGAGALQPVERIAGPILFVAGMEDGRWPAVEIADQIIDRLATHHFAHGVSLHSYGDAGHRLFGPPLTPVDPLAHRLSESGGSLDGNLRARRDSWRKTLDFLEDCIGSASGESRRSVLVHDEGWIGKRA